MRTEDVLEKWLVLATDSKTGSTDEAYLRFATDNQKEVEYPALGHKGIGRLAVAALGRAVFVWTRWGRGEEAQRTLLFIHWDLFRHPRLGLDDIIVPYIVLGDTPVTETEALGLMFQLRDWLESKAHLWKTGVEQALRASIYNDLDREFLAFLDAGVEFKQSPGTLFCVLGTTPEVDDIFRNEEQVGDEMSASEGLKLLLGFCDPFSGMSPRLSIKYFINNDPPKAERDFWTPQDFGKADHEINLKIDEHGFVKGTIRRLDQVIPFEYNLRPLPARAKLPGPYSIHMGYVQGRASDSRLTPDEHHAFDRRLTAYGSLYVYRDGIRVLPYGRTDVDFLQFENRRLKNAGRYFFSQRRMFGAINFTTRENSSLVDKAGREGFIKNSAYRGMVLGLQDLFIFLADQYFGRKADKEQERQAKHQEAEERAKARIKEVYNTFIQELTGWRARLPILDAHIDQSLRKAEDEFAIAQNLQTGSGVLIEKLEQTLNTARSEYQEAQRLLGGEVPSLCEFVVV